MLFLNVDFCGKPWDFYGSTRPLGDLFDFCFFRCRGMSRAPKGDAGEASGATREGESVCGVGGKM